MLLSVLSLCYEAFRQLYPVRLALAGMQAGVAAVILDVAWGLGKNVVRKKDRVDLVLMALVFIAQWFINLNTAVIILSAAAVGLARGLIRLYGKGKTANDLLAAFHQLLPGGPAERGRRLCGHAPDPESGGGAAPWLTLSEFTDLITIAEMTPGPIGINSATFVGIRIGGILGALLASLGFILPGCLIGSLLANLYRRWKDGPVLQGVLGALPPRGGGPHHRGGLVHPAAGGRQPDHRRPGRVPAGHRRRGLLPAALEEAQPHLYHDRLRRAVPGGGPDCPSHGLPLM